MLFSSAFLPAMDILVISLIGGLLKVLVWPFGMVLMAKDKMKVAVFLEIAWNVLFLVLAFYVMPIYKLEGVFVVQNISLLALFIFNYIYIVKTFSIKMTKSNLFMAIGSFLIILTVSFLKPLL